MDRMQFIRKAARKYKNGPKNKPLYLSYKGCYVNFIPNARKSNEVLPHGIIFFGKHRYKEIVQILQDNLHINTAAFVDDDYSWLDDVCARSEELFDKLRADKFDIDRDDEDVGNNMPRNLCVPKDVYDALVDSGMLGPVLKAALFNIPTGGF